MRHAIKRLITRLAPETSAQFFAVRVRRKAHQLVRQWNADKVNRAIISRYGRQVLAGPFAGMTLTSSAEAELFGPYLLGTYEAELHPFLEQTSHTEWPMIVDVGAKFGYYAIGLARKCPRADVVAFDTDPWARRAILEMMRANEVANVRIRGFCSRSWWSSNLVANSLIISDCEGYEAELFSSDTSAFASCTLVIETHDMWVPGVTEALTQRFQESHEISRIESLDYRVSPVDISFLPTELVRLATSEPRPAQCWLVCRPHVPAPD